MFVHVQYFSDAHTDPLWIQKCPCEKEVVLNVSIIGVPVFLLSIVPISWILDFGFRTFRHSQQNVPVFPQRETAIHVRTSAPRD